MSEFNQYKCLFGATFPGSVGEEFVNIKLDLTNKYIVLTPTKSNVIIIITGTGDIYVMSLHTVKLSSIQQGTL